jgi:hypothetical protein
MVTIWDIKNNKTQTRLFFETNLNSIKTTKDENIFISDLKNNILIYKII